MLLGVVEKQMKIVYIAHPISGDINGNVLKVLSLCKKYHTAKILPFAPYIVSLQYLDDTKKEDRERGIQANIEFFNRKIIDELWVCGDRVSDGMKKEIELAEKLKIPVVWKQNKK